jgi:selenocysteine-specific elongation factor
MENTNAKIGKVVQVIGPVVDVLFKECELPQIYTAIRITGEGFDGLYEAINQLATTCPPRRCRGLFRLWIERSFSIRGFGTVVSGIPSRGQVSVGDSLTLLPDNTEVRVRHLEVYGEEAQTGRSGECIAVNLPDVDAATVGRGKLLCEGKSFPSAQPPRIYSNN